MDIDLLINVVRPAISGQIGHRSKYTEIAHPGTNKKVKGWQWGEFKWPMYSELSEFSYVPTLFDAELGIPRGYYQSGYAGNEALLLKTFSKIKQNELNKWIPKLQTGNYYIHDKEWYLFSDQYISERLSIDGNFHHDLGYKPKELSPIFVRNYKRDLINSELVINKEIKFRISIDSDGNIEPPTPGTFTIDNSGTTLIPRLIFNAQDGTIAGGSFSFPVTADTTAVQFPVFPISIAVVEIPTGWTLDEDLGTLQRGTPDPSQDGTTLTVPYTPKFLVTYDPFFTKEEVDGFTANTNPLHVGTNRGFVQITTEILEPHFLELTTDLELLHTEYPNSYEYLLNLGNNVGKLKATVKNRVGTLLEGVRVYFDWEGQIPGGYGNHDQDPSSISDGYGNAYMGYTSPTTISDIGSYIHKDNIELHSDGSSSFVPTGVFASSLLNEVFIYEVRNDDPFHGLAEDQIETYYINYLEEEEITHTPGGSTSQEFEQWYRKRLDPYLHFPNSIPNGIDTAAPASNADPLTIEKRGQKRMLFESVFTESEYVHPNTGARGTINFFPLAPQTIENDGSVELRYDVDLKTADPNVYQYFVVSNKKIRARAWARNAAGQKIFSNDIVINITLPDSVNGIYYAQALNAIPEHHKLRLLRTDSVLTGDLNPITHSYTSNEESEATPATTEVLISGDSDKAYIPLGFRIKDAGITVAGMLNQVTFITKKI